MRIEIEVTARRRIAGSAAAKPVSKKPARKKARKKASAARRGK
jgi:hypothetical protein